LRRCGWAIAAGVVLGAASPGAAKEERVGFVTLWLVEPAPVPAGELNVAPGTLLIKQRLLPLGLAVLDDGYDAAKPEDSIAAGSQLIRMRSPSDKPIYCALRTKSNLLSEMLSTLPTKTMRCFVDDDKDGRFDRDVKASSSIESLPHPSGLLPKDPAPTIALRYSTRDISQFSENYYVGVKYNGQAMIGTLRRFTTVYGTEKRWGYFTGDNIFTKRDRDLPKTLEVLDSSFTVLGGDGKNVRIRVDRTMPAQPFGVEARVMHY
jgi:hypothetical protein